MGFFPLEKVRPHRKHIPEFYHPRLRELRYLYTISHQSLVEGCSWGVLISLYFPPSTEAAKEAMSGKWEKMQEMAVESLFELEEEEYWDKDGPWHSCYIMQG